MTPRQETVFWIGVIIVGLLAAAVGWGWLLQHVVLK